MNVRMLFLPLVLLLFAACSTVAPTEEPQPTDPPPTEDAAPEPTDIPPTEPAFTEDGCINTVEEGRDYFPDKVEVDYAEGFEVAYFDTYKVLTVTRPFSGATEDDTLRYLLVHCGAPVPEDVEADATFEVPVDDTILMSTTYVTMMDDLGLLDKVVGLDSPDFVNNEALRERIDAGELVAIGFGTDLNIEVALEADPDLIMTYSFGSPDTDSGPILEEANLPVAVNADYTEANPLGQAEWVKYIATFYNAEAQAQEVWATIETEYVTAAELAADVPERPTVLTNVPFEGTWFVSGGQSYVAQLIADAGAQYAFSDLEGNASSPLDFETVLEQAQDADYWINVGIFDSLEGLEAADERYAEFDAFEEGNVYNYTRQQTQFGNAYFESGPARPHLILLDLIKIFHPDLVPDHEFVYYEELN